MSDRPRRARPPSGATPERVRQAGGDARSTPDTRPRTSGGTPAPPDPVAAPPKTADRVSAVLAETPDATPAQIAARLGVSERTVRRYLPADKVPTRRRRPAPVPALATA
ncbi:helix-turn-helix domain-containing protein [Micromonospora sp. WMMD737]|uniref:helix-turn-helix domain-containing protein n=1 Tax=Micromonospora sp. WMMD737 TaxID=3404113 RepID=UPI003B9655E4